MLRYCWDENVPKSAFGEEFDAEKHSFGKYGSAFVEEFKEKLVDHLPLRFRQEYGRVTASKTTPFEQTRKAVLGQIERAQTEQVNFEAATNKLLLENGPKSNSEMLEIL